MSIYQNNFFIIPKKGDYSLFEGMNLSSFLDDIFFDDEFLWKNNTFNYDDIKKHLLKVGLEIGESWSEDLQIFGDNETNCIKIFIENRKIVSASFRINFLTDFSNFLKDTIEFCKVFNLFIVDNDLNILELDYEVIQNNLLNSKAFYNYNNFGNRSE